MKNIEIPNEKKKEIMESFQNDIKKKYGVNLTRYKDAGVDMTIKKLTTGSISADYVLGGGWGRFSEILGYPSSGKTTLALTAVAEIQKTKPDANILYLDSEYTLDVNYAKTLGVDVGNLYILQPDSSEDGYNIAETFIQTGCADFVVIDSIAAMIPRELTEKEIGEDPKIASMATLTTRAIQRLNRVSSLYDTPVLFINQYKDAVTIGGIPGGSGTVMGNTNKFAPGGASKDFYFQQILEVKRISQIKEKNPKTGVEEIKCNVMQIKTIKNKLFRPYVRGEITIKFGVGLDHVQELIGLSISTGVISQSGSFYNITDENGEKMFEKPIQGRAKLVEFFEDPQNVEVRERVTEMLKKSLENRGDTNEVLKIDKGGYEGSEE